MHRIGCIRTTANRRLRVVARSSGSLPLWSKREELSEKLPAGAPDHDCAYRRVVDNSDQRPAGEKVDDNPSIVD
ncbi:MAG: hypothetical protein JWP75_1837 [Frondihabitans sp.]|nr:hypothetical protein [Frondihabitans sp.]